MCGIAGCIGRNPPRTADWLTQMQDSLRKRGPDDCGMWQSANVALVHTRLSIIDVAGSPQPMTNHDASLVVTYNGEIYNYRNLRRQLQGRGHEFRTQGDTEVLLHLYRECGSTMLRELDGMFAFALYDARERKLLLARDRAGIKFLFYWHDAASGELAFASDLGTLMRNRAMPRSLNPRALAQIPALRLCGPRLQAISILRVTAGENGWAASAGDVKTAVSSQGFRVYSALCGRVIHAGPMLYVVVGRDGRSPGRLLLLELQQPDGADDPIARAVSKVLGQSGISKTPSCYWSFRPIGHPGVFCGCRSSGLAG